MKYLLLSILLSCAAHAGAQTPPVPIPHEEYAAFRYDTQLETTLLVYEYQDLWDFDGDGLKDELSFVSNGGAHAYYYPEIRLSSTDAPFVFRGLLIDMPYWTKDEPIGEMTQLSVIEASGEGPPRIFLDLGNHMCDDLDWFHDPANKARVTLSFEAGEWFMRNYE